MTKSQKAFWIMTVLAAITTLALLAPLIDVVTRGLFKGSTRDVTWPNEEWAREWKEKHGDLNNVWASKFIVSYGSQTNELGLRSDGAVVWREMKGDRK